MGEQCPNQPRPIAVKLLQGGLLITAFASAAPVMAQPIGGDPGFIVVSRDVPHQSALGPVYTGHADQVATERQALTNKLTALGLQPLSDDIVATVSGSLADGHHAQASSAGHNESLEVNVSRPLASSPMSQPGAGGIINRAVDAISSSLKTVSQIMPGGGG